jgi:hypothetical protein
MRTQKLRVFMMDTPPFYFTFQCFFFLVLITFTFAFWFRNAAQGQYYEQYNRERDTIHIKNGNSLSETETAGYIQFRETERRWKTREEETSGWYLNRILYGTYAE